MHLERGTKDKMKKTEKIEVEKKLLEKSQRVDAAETEHLRGPG